MDRMQVHYDLVQHAATRSASRTAEASHVSGAKVAKGVLLRDADGYTLAVLPASHHIGFPGIMALLACDARLASEREIDQIQFDPFTSPWAPARGEVVHVDPIDRPTQPHVEVPSEPAGVPPVAAATETNDFRGAVTAYERALLEDALSRSRFNQRATAAALGLSYDQLRHALKRHKLLDAAAAG